MIHRTKVLNSGTAYVPVCSCGWAGDDFLTPIIAKVAADKHEIENIRARSSKDLGSSTSRPK